MVKLSKYDPDPKRSKLLKLILLITIVTAAYVKGIAQIVIIMVSDAMISGLKDMRQKLSSLKKLNLNVTGYGEQDSGDMS